MGVRSQIMNLKNTRNTVNSKLFASLQFTSEKHKNSIPIYAEQDEEADVVIDDN